MLVRLGWKGGTVRRWACLLMLVGCEPGELSALFDLSDSTVDGDATQSDADADPDDGLDAEPGDAGEPTDDAASESDSTLPDRALPAPDGAPDAAPDAAPPPPDGRSEAEVCAFWRAEHVSVQPEWVASDPGDACDPGRVPADAQNNAIRRTNLYRWLAGLEPVDLDAARVPAQQACATVLAALRGLSHNLTPNNPCYTEAAAQGAGSSNLSGGGTLAGSVDLYVTDPGAGNAALGHRRWVLNPGMQSTAFGYKSGYGCMYSFSQGRQHAVEFVSWPPSGFVPVQAAEGRFHVSLYALRPGPDFRIEAGLNGAPGPVEFFPLQGGFGGQVPAYGFVPPAAGVWRAGNELTVALRGLRDHEDVVFTSRFVDCR